MTLSIDAAFIVLLGGSFFAAIFNAAFSIGGALIVLAATSAVLPVQAIVPLHSTLLIGSAATRTIAFYPHLDWRIVRPFLLGSLFGAAIGARAYTALPDAVLGVAIGLLMLLAIWSPRIAWRPRIRHPWAVAGIVHALLSTLFAYGVVLHSLILQSGLERRQVIGTMAGCLAGMSVIKITAYAWFGFDYLPYLPLIAAALALSAVGTLIGKRLGDRLSESHFRLAYRLLITFSALQLIYRALRP